MLEPFDFRSSFTDTRGFLTVWASRWIVQLTAQINSILNSIGIKSLNGDVTPAQTLVAGANVIITDDGNGQHTITAAGSSGAAGVQSINADTAPAQTLLNGTYIQVTDDGAGNHTINCTLPPGGGIQSINADPTAAQLLVAGANITITDDGGGGHTIAASGGAAAIPGPYADDTAAAGAGVAVGDPYYFASGFVVIRLV